VPNFIKIGQTTAKIWRFLDFQDGGRRHLGFSNFVDFNGRNAQDGQTASPGQILSKSVKPGLTYGDFRFFEMATAAILDFQIL